MHRKSQKHEGIYTQASNYVTQEHNPGTTYKRIAIQLGGKTGQSASTILKGSTLQQGRSGPWKGIKFLSL